MGTRPQPYGDAGVGAPSGATRFGSPTLRSVGRDALDKVPPSSRAADVIPLEHEAAVSGVETARASASSSQRAGLPSVAATDERSLPSLDPRSRGDSCRASSSTPSADTPNGFWTGPGSQPEPNSRTQPTPCIA